MDLICGDDMFRQCSASDVEPFSGQKEGFPAKKKEIWGVPEAKKGNLGVPEAFRRLTVQENSLLLFKCCSASSYCCSVVTVNSMNSVQQH